MTSVVTKSTVAMKDITLVVIGILRYVYNTISWFARFLLKYSVTKFFRWRMLITF